jgi:hypothetical protein
LDDCRTLILRIGHLVVWIHRRVDGTQKGGIMNDVVCLDCGEYLYAFQFTHEGVLYRVLICLNCLKAKLERLGSN